VLRFYVKNNREREREIKIIKRGNLLFFCVAVVLIYFAQNRAASGRKIERIKFHRV
jgi:hypothetical protein